MKKEKHITNVGVTTLIASLLIAAIIISAAIGRYPIGIREIFGIVFSKLFNIEPFWSATQASLLLSHRIPRIILACLVGCCLSAAGASYQGIFQNPMASPDILGASSGAAFGAALGILLGFGNTMIIVSAFVVSLLSVIIVVFVGKKIRGNSTIGLILIGIMISSLFSSGTSFIKLVADTQEQLPAITYWLIGSLNGAQTYDIQIVFIPMLIGLVLLILLRWRLNILAFGDEEATTMGVNVNRLRTVIIICATLLTASSVAVSGMIGWVGLIIPHLARRIVGNDFKILMPVTMLLGAVFMLVVDDVSRSLLATEIPIGILTSVIGAPFFIYLMAKGGAKE